MIRKISSATGGAEGPGALQGIGPAMVRSVVATMVETWRAALRRSRVPAVSQQHFPAPRDRRPPGDRPVRHSTSARFHRSNLAVYFEVRLAVSAKLLKNRDK